MSIDFPENDFTRMIEMTRSENRTGIRRNVGVASATPMPTVQSAAVGQPVSEPPPLTAEEREVLDKMAIEAGVRDPRLGNTDKEPSTAYGSLEEAIAAGAPVNRPVPTTDPTMDRMTAREFLGGVGPRTDLTMRRAAMAAIGAPRIPDFTKIEGIDLVNNRVVLDGLDFPISAEQAAEFKQFVMGVARDAILAKLEAAVALFTLPAAAETLDGDEAVQPMQDGEGTR
jgi:hypothetical protein